MKVTFLFLFLFSFLFAATGRAEGLELTAGTTSQAISEADLPPGTAFEGNFIAGARWTDKGGENYFIVSGTEHEKELKNDLFVCQYARTGGVTKLVWDIRDFSGPLCHVDVGDFSLQVIDLDGDGFMESSFIYQNRCDGLDPYVTKLMLHSKGQKLAIRGSVDVETGEQVEMNPDPAVRQWSPVFGNFMRREWEEFVENEGTVYAKTVDARGKGWMLLRYEYLRASGGTSYLLADCDGHAMTLEASVNNIVNTATDIDVMQGGQDLFVLSQAGIGAYNPVTGVYNHYVTLYEDNEALSEAAWSPDGTKVAFVSLNPDRYERQTQLFVLAFEGNRMVKKQKWDLAVAHHAYSAWYVLPPAFTDNTTIRYQAPGDEPGTEVAKVLKIH